MGIKIIFFVIASIYCSVFANNATIRGINDPDILSIAKSQISSKKKYSPDSIANKFRLENDIESIRTTLHSFGYFDSEIDLITKHNKTIFNVNLKERYKFDEVLLIYIDDKKYRCGLKIKEVFDLINIDFNSYTDTKQIADGCVKIKDFFEGVGFAFVSVNEPKLKIDKKNKKIKAIYNIILNRKTIVDKTIVNIKSKKDPNLLTPFVKNRIPWKDGSVYNVKQINDLKDELIKSGIFSAIDIVLNDPVNDEKNLKISHTIITINLEEALLRDVAAGVKYGTSEKAGILLSWANYNVDGKGSKISSILDLTKKTKIAKLRYNVYDLFYKEQELATQLFYIKENVSAYDVTRLGAESILWQTFARSFRAGIGGCCETSKTKDKVESDDKKIKFNAFGVPIGISFDTTNSFLDPQKGIRCSAMATPYFGNLKNITLIGGKGSFYIPIQKNLFKNTVVIAVYSKIGTIIRNKDNVVPRDKLFFCGGANSVRGYGYQKIGNINKDKKPLGGESLFEIGVEPRFRVSENVGLAVFVEGGNVYSSNMPKFMRKMLWGYGFGVRYYTPLGPIRLDLAFPTKRRKTEDGKKIDSLFNIYISIGQAF